MAISIADARQYVADRLNIATGEAITPPTATMIENDLRDAARRLFATLNPVYLTEVTLDANLEATVSEKTRIVHVETVFQPLYYSEWVETNTGILITGYRPLQTGTNKVRVWYTKTNAVASDASTINADCIHGNDWIYSPMLVFAEMQAEIRRSNTGDQQGAGVNLQRYRVLERMLEQEIGELRQRRAEDVAELRTRLEERRLFGPGAMKESGFAGFEHDVDLANFSTGSS